MKDISRSVGVHICILIIFTLCYAYWGYLQIIPDKNTLLHYYFNVVTSAVYLAGGILSFILYKRTQSPSLKNALLSFSIGLLSYAAAGLVWSYYNIYLRSPIPYPSIADAFYLAYPLCIGVGFWYLLDYLNVQPTKTNIKLSLIIVFLVYLCVFFIFMKPEIGDDVSFLARILGYAYPLSDAFLLTLAILAFTSVGTIGFGMGSLTASITALAVGDMLFTYRQGAGIYWNGDVSDLFFLVSAFFMMVGIHRIATSYHKHTE